MTLESIQIFLQNSIAVVVNISTLIIILITIIGLLVVIFRPRTNMVEAVASIFICCFAAIVLIRWIPPMIVSSSVDAVRASRASSLELGQEVNAWIWTSPHDITGYVPVAETAVPLPPLFAPTATPTVAPPVVPTVAATIIVLPTATAIPTVAPTVTPIVVSPNLLPPTPAIVTRTQ